MQRIRVYNKGGGYLDTVDDSNLELFLSRQEGRHEGKARIGVGLSADGKCHIIVDAADLQSVPEGEHKGELLAAAIDKTECEMWRCI